MMIHPTRSIVLQLGVTFLAFFTEIVTSATLRAPVSEITDFAFSFDIDGVLLLGDEPLPGARDTLLFLQNNSIPFVLLTNGGGKTEAARVAHLTEKLNVPLTVENFVQSHTPFKELVKGTFNNIGPLENKTVLVNGLFPDTIRSVTESYGFKNVVIPADIIINDPLLWPWNNKATLDYYKTIAQPLPGNVHARDLKVDAVMIFNDLTDWAGDLMIITDLLMSEAGYLGSQSTKNGNSALVNNGWQQDNQPDLIFSNGDFMFASPYPFPRFGQGAILAALKGIWREATGGAELKTTIMGKPGEHAYQYTEVVLNRHRAKMLGEKVPKLQKVYMIGDNPASDIKGANDFKSPEGTEWESILVETGVYKAGSTPKHVPKKTVVGVVDAVRWALEKEGYANAGDLV